MKTIQEIKSEMTNAILSNTILVEAMSLDASKTWEEQTSAAGILNQLLYINAVSWYALQWLMEQFKNDVEARILAALPGTASWYWNRAMSFQLGDNINSTGNYDVIDTTKQIIKYCAVVDSYEGVLIKINGSNHSKFASGSNELNAFTNYINALKFAGVRVAVSSLNPDEMKIIIAIKVNPLIIGSDMKTITSGEDVIKKAVESYLSEIIYGGNFNKTKLVDAIQAVEGVDDVILKYVRVKDETQNGFTYISTHNYTATAGSIKLATVGGITYENYN